MASPEMQPQQTYQNWYMNVNGVIKSVQVPVPAGFTLLPQQDNTPNVDCSSDKPQTSHTTQFNSQRISNEMTIRNSSVSETLSPVIPTSFDFSSSTEARRSDFTAAANTVMSLHSSANSVATHHTSIAVPCEKTRPLAPLNIQPPTAVVRPFVAPPQLESINLHQQSNWTTSNLGNMNCIIGMPSASAKTFRQMQSSRAEAPMDFMIPPVMFHGYPAGSPTLPSSVLGPAKDRSQTDRAGHFAFPTAGSANSEMLITQSPADAFVEKAPSFHSGHSISERATANVTSKFENAPNPGKSKPKENCASDRQETALHAQRPNVLKPVPDSSVGGSLPLKIKAVYSLADAMNAHSKDQNGTTHRGTETSEIHEVHAAKRRARSTSDGEGCSSTLSQEGQVIKISEQTKRGEKRRSSGLKRKGRVIADSDWSNDVAKDNGADFECEDNPEFKDILSEAGYHNGKCAPTSSGEVDVHKTSPKCSMWKARSKSRIKQLSASKDTESMDRYNLQIKNSHEGLLQLKRKLSHLIDVEKFKKSPKKRDVKDVEQPVNAGKEVAKCPKPNPAACKDDQKSHCQVQVEGNLKEKSLEKSQGMVLPRSAQLEQNVQKAQSGSTVIQIPTSKLIGGDEKDPKGKTKKYLLIRTNVANYLLPIPAEWQDTSKVTVRITPVGSKTSNAPSTTQNIEKSSCPVKIKPKLNPASRTSNQSLREVGQKKGPESSGHKAAEHRKDSQPDVLSMGPQSRVEKTSEEDKGKRINILEAMLREQQAKLAAVRRRRLPHHEIE